MSTTNLLVSWNEGTTKDNITNYITDVTNEESENFIPVEDRIATFDNDGTLWSEKPNYFQVYFMAYSVKAKAPNNPKLRAMKFVQEILDGDKETLHHLSQKDIVQLLAAAYENETTTEFEASVNAWLVEDRHPEEGVPFTDLIYQPMLELMDYLRANQFKVFMVSGGGMDFIRPWSYQYYTIPRNAVMGTNVVTVYDDNGGDPVIRRLDEINFVDDKEGKPVGIHRLIGKKPVFACGNSDGDLQMMRWADSNDYASFQLYLHHNDAVREWAYDRDSNSGQFDVGWDEAIEKGWTVIEMATDWAKVFPEYVKG
ncbi:MAG: HAD family hydrolase [Aureispira sp.]